MVKCPPGQIFSCVLFHFVQTTLNWHTKVFLLAVASGKKKNATEKMIWGIFEASFKLKIKKKNPANWKRVMKTE